MNKETAALHRLEHGLLSQRYKHWQLLGIGRHGSQAEMQRWSQIGQFRHFSRQICVDSLAERYSLIGIDPG